MKPSSWQRTLPILLPFCMLVPTTPTIPITSRKIPTDDMIRSLIIMFKTIRLIRVLTLKKRYMYDFEFSNWSYKLSWRFFIYHFLCILTTCVVMNRQRDRPLANTPHNPKNMKTIHTNNVDASFCCTFSESGIWLRSMA